MATLFVKTNISAIKSLNPFLNEYKLCALLSTNLTITTFKNEKEIFITRKNVVTLCTCPIIKIPIP